MLCHPHDNRGNLAYIKRALDQQRILTDNTRCHVIIDRRVAEIKIVAFSVNDKRELVCTDDAMPAGYQTPPFGLLLAMAENGKIATAGNDGDTSWRSGHQASV